jgi:hypothetical protein
MILLFSCFSEAKSHIVVPIFCYASSPPYALFIYLPHGANKFHLRGNARSPSIGRLRQPIIVHCTSMVGETTDMTPTNEPISANKIRIASRAANQ